MVNELPALMSELSLDVLAMGDSEGGGGGVKGSPALIRLDVLALIDPRTMYEASKRSDGSIATGPVHVWAALRGWASSLRDAMAGDSINTGDLAGRSWDLIDHFGDLIGMVWIDDCFEEIADMYRQVSRAVGIESARSIGRCVTTWPVHWLSKERTEPCGQAIFAESGALIAQCSRCGTRYRGMDLVRMQLQQKGIE